METDKKKSDTRYMQEPDLKSNTCSTDNTMQVGMKRKHSSDTESGTDSDETWTPSSCSQGTESPTVPAVCTRSRGPVERPADQAKSAMDLADAVVDNESDLSSDTEKDDEEDDEESGEEEEEERLH